MMRVITQLVCAAVLGLTITTEVHGRIRHCYVCRSRGDQGDCKDPFRYNGTTVQDVKGVEATPCASGWCGKIVEGESADFNTATERLCVQRPPSDGEERCANTIIDRKKVYMCFCLGDLCNGAGTAKPSVIFAVPLLAAIFVNWMRWI